MTDRLAYYLMTTGWQGAAENPTDVPVLDWNQTVLVMGVVLVSVLAAGLLVILGRRLAPHKDPRAGLVRSWIAISLVLGLLVFCAASLAIGDSTLRSTLVGALAAAVGAAIAFYFSAHQADQSRQDLLTAAAGTVTVPEITDLTLAKASALLAKTSLRLLIDPASSALADDDRSHVATQEPDPGTEARRGSTVRITLEPSPDTTTGTTSPTS